MTSFRRTSVYRPAALAVLAVVGAGVSVSQAAPAKKAPARKAAQPAKKAPKLIREVLGTTQLQGYEGRPGETFTLGKNMPFNFTLRSAEYSVSRVNFGGNTYFPKGDEKMLVLRFTVQNPTSRVFNYSYSYIKFTAVDSTGVSREHVGDVAREVTNQSGTFPLNPGQKIDVYTTIKVAAFGAVPKLIVRPAYETEAPIVRYDLRNVAKRLPAPFSESKDPATALKTVPAKSGVFYPVTDLFDMKLDSVEYSEEPIANRELKKDYRYFFAKFTIKNRAPRPARYGYSYFRADLRDADGEKTEYNTSILKASRDEESSGELAPGEEARIRFYFAIPKSVDAKTVLVQYGYDRESRTYAFAVPAAK